MPDRDWMCLAACAGHPNPDIFFPSAKGRNANAQIAEALRICAICPVMAACQQYCRDTGSAFGVWGGGFILTQRYGHTGQTRLSHGTEAMYKRHLRMKETPCHSCRVAQHRARSLRRTEGGA